LTNQNGSDITKHRPWNLTDKKERKLETMKRLSIEALQRHQQLIKVRSKPFDIFKLHIEKHKQVPQLQNRHEELSIRFSHQLERLQLAEHSLKPSISRQGINSLKILTSLHVDSCEKLLACNELLER
jgi:hypothetical protein